MCTDFEIMEHIMAKVERNQGRRKVLDEVNIFIKVKEGKEKAHPPVKEDELNSFYLLSCFLSYCKGWLS